tara:strand:- start:895 stop:1113 length:219 start_codon:yes stop_codon:yes gene_type:complete
MKLLIGVLSAVVWSGCTSPTAPVNCLGSDVDVVYERLEGVRAGDPDYKKALAWSSICPEWNLIPEVNVVIDD